VLPEGLVGLGRRLTRRWGFQSSAPEGV
jgi:hypothetical protein